MDTHRSPQNVTNCGDFVGTLSAAPPSHHVPACTESNGQLRHLNLRASRALQIRFHVGFAAHDPLVNTEAAPEGLSSHFASLSGHATKDLASTKVQEFKVRVNRIGPFGRLRLHGESSCSVTVDRRRLVYKHTYADLFEDDDLDAVAEALNDRAISAHVGTLWGDGRKQASDPPRGTTKTPG